MQSTRNMNEMKTNFKRTHQTKLIKYYIKQKVKYFSLKVAVELWLILNPIEMHRRAANDYIKRPTLEFHRHIFVFCFYFVRLFTGTAHFRGPFCFSLSHSLSIFLSIAIVFCSLFYLVKCSNNFHKRTKITQQERKRKRKKRKRERARETSLALIHYYLLIHFND